VKARETEELLQGRDLVEQLTAQKAGALCSVDHRNVESETDQVQEVPALPSVGVMFGRAERIDSAHIDLTCVTLGQYAHRIGRISWVETEIAPEIIARSTGKDPQYDIVPTTRDKPVCNVTPGPVTTDCDYDVVAFVHRSFGEVPLFPWPGGSSIGHVLERSIQERPVPIHPFTPPASTGRGVEDDEVPPSCQKVTILSNVWRPLPYHSSRNGYVFTSSIVSPAVIA